MLVLSITGAAIAQPATGAANSYPSKPIRMVIPYAAGGGPDVAARIIADNVTPGWNQSFVFDNGGGGGVIGAAIVAKALPDGYTMLLHTVAYSSMPFFCKSLLYDPVRDLTPITLVAKTWATR